ncbi:MAG: hypothetical protein VXB74_12565, partial [Deltaproteobacteria bacterium]
SWAVTAVAGVAERKPLTPSKLRISIRINIELLNLRMNKKIVDGREGIEQKEGKGQQRTDLL